MLAIIALVVSFLILATFFSFIETAFSKTNKIKLKKFADENRKEGKKISYIIDEFSHLHWSVFIGNYLSKISAVALFSNFMYKTLGNVQGMVITIAALTPVFIFVGEIWPHSFVKNKSETVIFQAADILIWLNRLFKPITMLFFIHEKPLPSITEEELKQLVNLGEEEGIIDHTEKELLQNSLQFDDILVSEIITPRTEMVAIDVKLSIEEITAILLDQRYSRIPVYEGTIDHIIGILYERDFFYHLITKSQFQLREILRKPLFVTESMHISALLAKLQKKSMQMAIVIDEFGGTAGLVTLEDILEQLVGEIWDEHDEKVLGMRQIKEHTFEFSGDYPLDEFARRMNIDLPDSKYHTLGGWIAEIFQEIPNVNEQFAYEHLQIVITEVAERRIKKVLVHQNA